MAAFSFCFSCSLLLLLEEVLQIFWKDTLSFLADVEGCILVPVHGIPTGWTDVSPVRKFQIVKDMSTAAAGLRGREPAVHLHQKAKIVVSVGMCRLISIFVESGRYPVEPVKAPHGFPLDRITLFCRKCNQGKVSIARKCSQGFKVEIF